MHSVKGGWVGQTFALAKRNESASEGRKSRIRRSKEERKAMVQSFINKYQESNNGNFPSLNLTHKEVGGSFYTVREIVRDIIQENRVLGPAKFTLEDLTSDNFFEQNPLGSIAADPQSSNENHPVANNLQDTSGKMLSVSNGTGSDTELVMNVSQVDVINKELTEATIVSDGYYTGAEHQVVDKGHVMDVSQVDVTNNESVEAAAVSDGYYTGAEHQIVDKGRVINGSQVDVINKESSDATIPEMQVSEPTAPTQNVELELATAATPMAKVTTMAEDLIVETFPLRPVARTTDRIEGLGELRGSSNSPEKDIKMLELEQGEERSELNAVEPTKNSNLWDEKFDDALGNQTLKTNSNTGHDEEKNVGDALAESAEHSAHNENLDHEFEDCADPQVKASHQNTVTFETINQSKMIDGAKTSIQDGFQATKTYTEESKPLEEGLQEANKHRVDGQLGGSSQRRSNPTLDRINLESWEGTPKNSAKQEPNPLLAILKAFVDALVKFWSE